MSDLNFQPLLFGGDINVYSVARAFHEAYGVRSIAFGKYPSFPCHGSAILDYRVCPDNESADAFRRNVRAVAQEFPDKTVLLLGCGDSYVQLAAHCKDQLPDNVAAPYIDGALLDTLINKEKFYQLCDRYGIDHPATFIYDKSMGHDFTLPFGPPYIAKPADSVAYWATGVHAYEASFARIGAAILEAPGVEDYTGLTVNGGTVNIRAASKQAAVLGEVVVRYAP